MEESTPYLPLLLITLLAAVVPVLASRLRRLRLPIVVAEIVAGIVIGRSGLNIVEATPILTFLADFGFTFLMFLSGLEVNFDTLHAAAPTEVNRPRWARPVTLALLAFGLTLAMAGGLGWGLTRLGLARSPVLMGLILSTTSLGIVVSILKERALTITPYGQLLLVSALIGDFVTLLLLSLSIAVVSRGLSLDLFLFLLLLALFLLSTHVGQRVSRLPLIGQILAELSHATAQIRVRGAFALMVAWVVLAKTLGVEIILGAFLAGAIISMTVKGDGSVLLREKLDAIGYGFFIPIFFIMVGVNFDLQAILTSRNALALVPLLLVAAYLVKIVPALLFRVILPWRETLAAGFLLSSRLSLIIAAATIALNLDLIAPATNAAVVLVAVVTCTLSPLAFHRLFPASAEKVRSGVIILGADQLATLVAERLRKAGEAVMFVGTNGHSLDAISRRGFRTVVGHPSDPAVLAQAGAANARAIIASINDPDQLLHTCQLAREQFGVPILIARADDPNVVSQLRQLGVRAVQPAMATAVALEGALHFPASFDMLVNQEDDVDIRDVILVNPRLIGQVLSQVVLPGHALLLGIRRNGEVLVPHGDTVLHAGDVLMMVGSSDSLVEARAWAESRA